MSLRIPIRFLSQGFHRIFISAAVLLCSASVWAGTFSVFGPKTYVRSTGAPVTVTDTFAVPNTNGQFVLHLSNGGLQNSSDFVSSAVITVNGVTIVSPSDLNQNVSTLDKPVQLQASNTISVQLRSKPGSQIAVQILGIDNTPPTITASASPAANAAGWNNTNVTVTFTCSDDFSGVASCPAPVTVSTEGANQVVSGTATDNAGNSATASVTLKIDKTPPVLNVTSPANNATVGAANLQLTGTVTDALSGVATTTCNGAAAVLQGNSFTCSVTLVAGPNTVSVSATDVAGNSTSQSLTVTFGGQPVIADFNPKSAPVGSLITLTGSNLVPTNGGSTQVTLNQQGGGTIAAPISSASASSLSFVIPSGAATGPVTVTVTKQSAVSTAALSVVARSNFGIIVGPATANVMQGKTGVYTVSLTSSSGFGQLASLQVSGLPSGVTASFLPAQITAGQTSNLTVTTTAGQATGASTLTISASATVDGIPSTQSATASLVIQPVTTSLLGRVVESDTQETALGGITITLLGVDDAGNHTGCTGQTVSDAAGNFSVTNLPSACVGRQLVAYNGNTATDGEKYASVNLAYTLVAGQATGPELVHLPQISDAETVMVQQNSPNDQTFSFKTMPGLSVTVYAGTIFTLPDGTQPNPFPFTGVQVPVDRLPDTPIDGPGALRAYIIAFQPADSTTNLPVAVIFPNTLNTPPGVNMELDTLDPVRGELVKYGTGTVSGDGTSIVPDFDPASPGHRFGIRHFDWHGPMAPGPNGNNPGPDGNGPDGGDPVDPASGLMVIHKTDLAFDSARGRVEIVRTYRTLSGTPGPFGVGTSHNYGFQLNTFNFIQGQGTITVIMPDGNQFPYTRQADGTFINSSIPSLRGSVLTTPTSGSFRLRWKDGTVYNFQSPPTGSRVAYLNSIVDRVGNTITLVRGNSTNPIQITQITDPVGRQTTLAYDNFDRITAITDPIGRSISYTYNSQGTLATVTDVAGGVTTYAYDSQNRLTQVTDPKGITFIQNTYDANGKVIRQVQGDGGVTTFAYTLLNPTLVSQVSGQNTSPVVLTTVTDPLGNQTTYHYSPQGFLLDVTDALGEKSIYQRDPGTNLVTSATDPLNRVTAFVYDSVGNVTSVTRVAGTPDAVTTSFTFELNFNRLTSVTDPLNQKTTMAYDNVGNLLSTTDPLNHQLTFTYDSFGELLSSSDALGNKTLYTYNNGNIASITDPVGNTTTQVFDGVGRTTSSVSPQGQTTHFSYNALNKLLQLTDAVGSTTSFIYDPNGNLTGMTDALGHRTSYAYDQMDRLITLTDPLSRSENYQYDFDGNLTQFTDRRGKITTFQYDALNRRVFAGFGTTGNTTFESTISYNYDSVSRVLSAVDSIAGTISNGYDDLDRLTSAITPQGSVTYTYDALGRRTHMAVTGQAPVSYSFDVNSRVTQIAQGTSTVSFSYDNADRRTSLTLPNGVVASYQYDADSRLTSITYQNGLSLLGSVNYAYDSLGRRTQVSGSLTQSAIPQPIASATYDSANELTSWNGTNLSYDANGNLLSDGSNSYSWNARNQLAAFNGSNSTYDALGRRTQNFQGTSFLYDGTDSVLELAGTSTIASRLTGSPDEFFSRTDSSGTATPLVDALGSVLALTDQNAAVQTRYTYEPFGNTTTQGAANTNPFQFTGRESDFSNLYFYRARYYSPVFHRFISEDPAGFHGGDLNLYTYVIDSPPNFRDPQGRFVIPLIIAGIGGTIGAISDGIKAYSCGKRGWDLAADVGRGFAGGAVGSLVGLGLGAINPILGGAGGSLASDATKWALGGGWNTTEALQNAAVGGALGPIAEALGPEVRGGNNFDPWTSPRTWGPKAEQAYAREGISDTDNAAFDQGRNLGKQMAGRKDNGGEGGNNGKKPGCE